MNAFLGNLMIFYLIFDKYVIFIILSFLVFIEWSIEKTYYEVRFIFLALYSNLLLLNLIMFTLTIYLNL